MPGRIILVNHGESHYNTQVGEQSSPSKPILTQKGQASAYKTGLALKDIPLSAVYTIPDRCARETANQILSAMDSKACEPLIPQFLDIVTETVLFERAKQFWEQIVLHHNRDTILIVGSCETNAAIINTGIGVPLTQYDTLQQSNCGISILKLSGKLAQPVQLELLNLTGHLGEDIPKLKNDHPTLRLFLVRHTETEWNQQKRFQGRIDIPLNETGYRHASKVAEFLKEERIDFAISSSLNRPRQTTELILKYHKNVDIKVLDDLIEMSYGAWEGKSEIEVKQKYPGELERWYESPSEVQITNGEHLYEVWKRVTLAWNSIIESCSILRSKSTLGLVVAHDVINKIILCNILQLSPNQFWSLKQINGGVSVIDYSLLTGKPVIQSINLTPYQSSGVHELLHSNLFRSL